MSTVFTARAVLFDLDGVLVDSQSVIDEVWARWATRHGLAPEEVLPHIHGRRSVELIRRFAPAADEASEVAWVLAAEVAAAAGLRPYAGAVDMIAALGPTRMAVVTSGARTLAAARLSSAGLPIPAVFVTADDVTTGKPSPEGYRRAADLLGIPAAECVVIEDAPAGIAAGRAAGAQVIGLSTTMPATTLGEANIVVPNISALRLTLPADAAAAFELAMRGGRHATPPAATLTGATPRQSHG